jgi:glycosyltransferase involved in cell wall biosynthesis
VGDVLTVRSRRVAELIEAARPDLVHTNNLAGFSTSVWESARRLGLPVVHTLHDYHLLCPRVSLMQRDGTPCCPHATFCKVRTRRLARWAGAVSDVVCGSDHLWTRLGHLFPQARPHVVRVPIVPLGDRPLRPPNVPLRTVGYLGGIDRIKGIDALLEAAPALHERGVELRLAGTGRLRSLVEAEVGPGLSYSGTVLGEARLLFFEEADVAVVPSIWEEANGPPYVVAEWLAAGRPVLASTRGGLGEAAQLPGVLPIEPTADGIVSAVERLTDEQIWRETIGSLAQAEGDADLQRWLDDHEAIYERAAAGFALRSSTSS